MKHCSECGVEGAVECKNNTYLCAKCDIQTNSELTGNHPIAEHVHKLSTESANKTSTRGSRVSTQSQRESSDINDIKNSLQFICHALDQINKRDVEQKEKYNELNIKVTSLSNTVDETDRYVKALELRVLELEKKTDVTEQEKKMNNVIISGIDLRNFSNVTSSENNEQSESTRSKVVELASKINSTITEYDIVSIFPLPKGKFAKADSPPRTVIKFRNHEAQQNFYSARFKLKEANRDIYINEDLTKMNSELYKTARSLKREDKIEGVWTKDCCILVKKGGKTIRIRNESDLGKLI